MMDEKTFAQLANEAKAAIVGGRLSDALLLMKPMIKKVGDTRLSEERETVEEDYDRLLHFMRTGGKDKARTSQQLRLVHKAVSLLQETRRLNRLSRQDDIYSEMFNRLPRDLNSLPHGWKEMDDTDFVLPDDKLEWGGGWKEDLLFDLLWTSPQLSPTKKDMTMRLLDRSSRNGMLYYVSALALSLLEYFDAQKLDILLDCCQSPDAQLRSRALVGACVASQLHSGYVMLYPELCDKFGNLNLNKEIFIIQHAFCLYQEIDNAQHKIRQHMSKKKSKGDEGNGIEVMFGMFRDGIDINLNTLGMMKKFPFFGKPNHWLRYYRDDWNGDESFSFIEKLNLCDSDKHSLRVLLMCMPDDKSKEMAEQMSESMNEILETISNVNDVELAYQNVIQCLARLLLRSPWSSEWPDVFSPQMVFVNNPVLRPMLINDVNYLGSMGKTLLKYNRYAEAKKYLRLLRKIEGESAELIAAIGKCEVKEGNLHKAVKYYRQAADAAPGKKTYLWELQQCLQQMGRHADRLECLMEIEKLYPDDAKVLTECGLCLMSLGRWQEAKSRFFKLEFSDKCVVQSVRAIAWCALQLGDLKLAHSYYQRLHDADFNLPTWEDHLNYAHILWLTGDAQEALAYYKRYVANYISSERNVKDPLKPFDNDRHILLDQGMTEWDIWLLHDLIAKESNVRTGS